MEDQHTHLLALLQAFPPDTVIPMEAVRVRDMLEATMHLLVVFRDWRSTGVTDTTPVRYRMDQARRTYDTNTPTTDIYEHVQAHMSAPPAIRG